jgi:hypothetical protein
MRLFCLQIGPICQIYLKKLELFIGEFYPVIPNNGCKSRKSWSKRFEFSTLGATNVRFGQKWEDLGGFGIVMDEKGQYYPFYYNQVEL